MKNYKLLILITIHLLCHFQSKAADYTIANGDVNGLINAIVAAGKNADADVITLAANGIYTLTVAHEEVFIRNGTGATVSLGKAGLPIFKGTITIIGNGAIISRATSAPPFRIMYLAGVSTLSMQNVTIQNGSIDQDGAGLHVGFNSKINLDDVKFINNICTKANYGGGIAIYSGSVAKLQNCTFTGNITQTGGIGGGIYNVISNLTLTNCTFDSNKGGAGGGIYIDGALYDTGTINIIGCTFSKNTCESEGGGLSMFLYNTNTAIIDKCKFLDNSVRLDSRNLAFGGGLCYSQAAKRGDGWSATTPLDTKLTLSNSIFQRNNSQQYGGGIYVGKGTLTMSNIVIANNNSDFQGGAIWNSIGKVSLSNSTIYQNKANGGSGGGILNYQGDMNIANCTIAENTTLRYAGGIDNNLGTLTMSNTILQNNIGTLGNNHYRGGLAMAKFVDGGNNIYFPANNTTSSLGLPTTSKLADALLSPLADNGGNTLTMALKAGSPAINAGNNCSPTDQRGSARVGICDIGAFEFGAAVVPILPLPTAPTTLLAEIISSSQIRLNWTDNSTNEIGFKIERSVTSGGNYAEIAQVGIDIKTFADNSLQANTKYFYRVRAFNNQGNSDYTNEANATTALPLPTAPTTLLAEIISSSQIRLNWTDNSTNEIGFKIERSITSGGSYAEIAQVGIDIKTFTDNSLQANTKYFYRVRAFNNQGNSDYTNEANVTTPIVAPTTPSMLLAEAISSSQIRLNWADNTSNETGFKIERSVTSGTGYAEITQVVAGIKTFTDNSLQANTKYFYRVRAFSGQGNSDYSNEANATTAMAVPATPFTLLAEAISSSQIRLNWTDNTANEGGFKIERSTTSGSGYAEITQIIADTKTFTDNGLQANTKYFYRMRAFNAQGNSAYSSEANATTNIALPLAPSTLTGQPLADNQISLNWTDNATNEIGFKIERSNTAATGFVEIGQTAADIKTFTDKKLQAGTNYFYRVRAFNIAGNSEYSNELSISTVVGVSYIDISHQLNAYPNPTEGRLFLQIDNAIQGAIKVRMTDLLGKTIMEEVWHKYNDKLNKDLNMSNLGAGVFIIEIMHENYRAVKRIVKH